MKEEKEYNIAEEEEEKTDGLYAEEETIEDEVEQIESTPKLVTGSTWPEGIHVAHLSPFRIFGNFVGGEVGERTCV